MNWQTGIATGYFGIPGREGGQVHAVLDGRPVCALRLHRLAEFQWCADGIVESYLECERCKKSKFVLVEIAAREARYAVADKQRRRVCRLAQRQIKP